MKVIQGHTITLKAIISGVERFFAGTVENDFNLAFDVAEKLTKKDGGQRRYELGGYGVNIGISGITEISETTTEKTQNLSRSEILDIILAAAPVKFVYDVDGDILSGELILYDFTETSGANSPASYVIRAKLSGALTRYRASGVYILNSLTASNLYDTDTTLAATANISADAAGGYAYLKFKWILSGGNVVEFSNTYTFAPFENKNISVSAAAPAGLIAGSYVCEISGAVSGSSNFTILPTFELVSITTPEAVQGDNYTLTFNIKNNSGTTKTANIYASFPGLGNASGSANIAAGATIGVNVSKVLTGISGNYTITYTGAAAGNLTVFVEIAIILQLAITNFSTQSTTLTTKSASSFKVDWGNGVIDTIPASSSDNVKTHSYTANGDYTVKMYAGVRNIYKFTLNAPFKINSNIDLSSLTGAFNNINYITLQSANTVNKITAPKTQNHTFLATHNSTSTATILYKELDLTGCKILTTRSNDISTYTVIVNRYNTPFTTLNITDFVPASTDNAGKGISSQYSTGLNSIIGNVGWCRYLYINDCAFNQTSIDRFLAELVAGGNINGTFNAGGGNNAAPSAAGVANKNILVSRGWVVTTK